MFRRLLVEKKRRREEAAWLEKNERYRIWLMMHPMRVADPELRRIALNWTEVARAELSREIKNTRRPGRVQLRDRLKFLVTAILTQNQA